MSQWRATADTKEISGYAVADESGVIVWQYMTASGNQGTVESTADQQASAIFVASEKGLVINVQWHTHGTMQPFFSLTDEQAQRNYLKHSKSGAMWFVCFGGMLAICRRVEWDEHGPRMNMGDVWLGEIPLPTKHGYQGDGDDGVVIVYAVDDNPTPSASPAFPLLHVPSTARGTYAAALRKVDNECDALIDEAIVTVQTAEKLNQFVQDIEIYRYETKKKLDEQHMKKGDPDANTPTTPASAQPQSTSRPIQQYSWLRATPVRPAVKSYDPRTVNRFTP